MATVLIQNKLRINLLLNGYIRLVYDHKRIPEALLSLIESYVQQITFFTLNKDQMDAILGPLISTSTGTRYNTYEFAIIMEEPLTNIRFCCKFTDRTLYGPWSRDYGNFYLMSLVSDLNVETSVVYYEIFCQTLGIFVKGTRKLNHRKYIRVNVGSLSMFKELTKSRNLNGLTFGVYVDVLHVRYVSTTATDNSDDFIQKIRIKLNESYHIEMRDVKVDNTQVDGIYSCSFGVNDNWCLVIDEKQICLKILRLPMRTSGINVRYSVKMDGVKACNTPLTCSGGHYFNYYANKMCCKLFRDCNELDFSMELHHLTFEVSVKILSVTDLHRRQIRQTNWSRHGIIQ
eukprot:16301_1